MEKQHMARLLIAVNLVDPMTLVRSHSIQQIAWPLNHRPYSRHVPGSFRRISSSQHRCNHSLLAFHVSHGHPKEVLCTSVILRAWRWCHNSFFPHFSKFLSKQLRLVTFYDSMKTLIPTIRLRRITRIFCHKKFYFHSSCVFLLFHRRVFVF